MELEKKYIVSWFQNLSKKEKEKVTYVTRLYSYHFDVYINNIYRNKIFPRYQLLSHANEIIADIGMHNMWITSMYTDDDFKNKFCREKPLDKSPFKDFVGDAKINLSSYVNTIKNITLTMHSVFTDPKLSYVLQNELIVYRALRIRKSVDDTIDVEKDINLEITGTTSTTTELEDAQQFAFSLYGESDFYDERKYKSIIFEITLPKGTRIIPVNICTIQNENEILVISQGTLKIKRVVTDYCNWWNDYFNSEGEYIRAREDFIPYKLAKVDFEINKHKNLVYNPTIKISERIDNEFDDIVIDDIDSTDFGESRRRKSSGRSKRRKSVRKSGRIKRRKSSRSKRRKSGSKRKKSRRKKSKSRRN